MTKTGRQQRAPVRLPGLASNLGRRSEGPRADADAEVPEGALSEGMSVDSGPEGEVRGQAIPGQAIHPGLAVRLPGMASNLCETSEGPRADADVEVFGDAASELSEGLCVRLTGLEERGLNDLIGTLVKFRTEWRLWQVNVDGDSLLVKASNLCERREGPRADADAQVPGDAPSELAEGMAVRVRGLPPQQHPEINWTNGQIGILVKFRPALGRWQLNVEGHGYLLMASNLCRTGGGPTADADAEVPGDAPSKLLEGMSVRLTGLPLEGQNWQGVMNGCSGTLGKFHPDLGRWEVLNVEDGWGKVGAEALPTSTRLLKAANLCKTSAGPSAGADAEGGQEASSQDILARGIYNCCRKHLWPCDQCKDEKARADYSDGQWNHRHSRGAVCRVCAEARCELCDCLLGDEQHQCAQCQHYKTAAHFSESMWQHRLTRRTVCSACAGVSARQATVQCELCGEHFTAEGFTRGMWEHKSRKGRTLCKTCCRPPCSNAECTTCKKCRDPRCTKRLHCEAEVEALNPKQLPKTVEKLETWLCAKCRPTFCSNWPWCTAQRSTKTAASTDQYTCGGCKRKR